jgi:hypothetical protein
MVQVNFWATFGPVMIFRMATNLLYLVRHGEADHDSDDPGADDPRLTALGRGQADRRCTGSLRHAVRGAPLDEPAQSGGAGLELGSVFLAATHGIAFASSTFVDVIAVASVRSR